MEARGKRGGTRPRGSTAGARRATLEPGPFRQASLAFALVVGLLVVVVGTAVVVGLRINEHSRRTFVHEAIPLTGLVQDLVLQLVNQETGVRGFVATGNPASLGPYRAGRRAAANDLEAIEPYLPRHPELAALLAELRPRIARLDRELSRQIRLVRAGPRGRELARARVVEERLLFDRIRVVTERMLAETRRFVAAAQRRQDEDVRRLIGVLLLFGLGALVVGGTLAVAVPRKLQRAHLAERRARLRVERMREVQHDLSGSLDAEAVRTRLLELALELGGSASATIVTDAPTALPYRRIVRGTRREIRGALEPGSSLARAFAALDGSGSGLSTVVDEEGRRLLVLDLGGDVETREALVVDEPADRSGDQSRTLLEMLARQGRQTLENARRYEREHRIAETLQRTAMPETLTDVDGLRFAARYLPGSSEADIGGDWYDVFAGRDGSVWAVVGDVGGKGVIAAARMGQLRSVVRALALGAARPGELLRAVNRTLQHEDWLFATLVVLTIEPATATCRFALAGHPPPLLVESGGRCRFLDGGRNVPLGAEVDLPTVDDEVRLRPGDTLVLYTDGLVEKHTQPLDEGMERLLEAAAGARRSSVPFLDGLLARMVPEARRADDVALLSIAVEEVPGIGGADGHAARSDLADVAAPGQRPRAAVTRRRGGTRATP